MKHLNHDTRWQAIGPSQKDGDEWIVGFDRASVWIVRSAWWDEGEFWDFQAFDNQDEARGWWSYRNSVTQEKLEGQELPTHYLCQTPEPPGD